MQFKHDKNHKNSLGLSFHIIPGLVVINAQVTVYGLKIFWLHMPFSPLCWFSHPSLLCLVFPKVIVLVRVTLITSILYSLSSD